jgi:tyrosine-protein kinase Etk/Wzc
MKAIFIKYAYHWPLFVVGLILSAALAYTYLCLVNPVYEISATILVKDEKKSPEEKKAMPELDQSTSSKNAEAEIEILRSKKLVSEVVSKLQLWVSYKTRDGLTTRDLYDNVPFQLVFMKKVLVKAENNIRIIDENTFETTDLSGNKQRVAFNTPVTNRSGTWLLKPGAFTKQYIGSDIRVGAIDPELVSNAYLKELDAHLLDKLAPTIGLFVNDEVPQRGKDFLNELITAYNGAAADEQKRATKRTIDFIDTRLASLTGELNQAEKQVAGYRSSQGLTDISSQANAYLENVQTNDVKLNEVNVQLNVIRGIERYVNSPAANGSAPATIGISDPALNSSIERLSELQSKRTALLGNTPEGNPLFGPINQQIAMTKASIKETVRGIKSSLANSQRELQSFNNKTESSIKAIPVQERQFVSMKRQQSIKENLYVYLLQKREEMALSYAANFSDARIVDQANLGDVVSPKIPLLVALALLGGLGIPFLLIYFRSSFGNKITGRQDLDALQAIPILAELSYEDLGDQELVVKGNQLIGEQFRMLRTNLNYLHQDGNIAGKGRVTMLTSSISKEGKSFVSSNLAASLAISGRKTVLLEMDLRKPKVLKIFNLSSGHPGISEYLMKTTSVQAITQPSGKFPGLDLIGSGQIPANPTELLETEQLAGLITALREQYDEIIIDTAPLHLVTDALVIAKTADASLYIIRQGYTGKEELNFIKEIFDGGKLPAMQLVFNGIRKNKYGYGYSYDQSYYSGRPETTGFKWKWKQLAGRF